MTSPVNDKSVLTQIHDRILRLVTVVRATRSFLAGRIGIEDLREYVADLDRDGFESWATKVMERWDEVEAAGKPGR